jgi:hypothetical protein
MFLGTLTHTFPAGVIAKPVSVAADFVPITINAGIVEVGDDVVKEVGVAVVKTPPTKLYVPVKVELPAIPSAVPGASFNLIAVVASDAKLVSPEVKDVAQYLFVFNEANNALGVPPVAASTTSDLITTTPVVKGFIKLIGLYPDFPTGKRYVEPETKLVGKVLSIAPFKKLVALPPVTEFAAELVTVIVFPVLSKIPAVNVSTPVVPANVLLKGIVTTPDANVLLIVKETGEFVDGYSVVVIVWLAKELL